ncbi:hypothetical protein [Thermus caliditerrae]|uniref:hypothetical protein n=1 Tax=Thermus caliditerrae TaxID=1330700 RepID=UPI001F3B1C38|nr:hypothetical protein [Thermus caliditerrae]
MSGKGRWTKMAKAAFPLLLLGLMGAVGGCNLQGTGGGGAACQHPLFGPETPKWVCSFPEAWLDTVDAQPEDLPSGTPGELLGEVQGVPGEVTLRAGAHGPALGYLKIPGFPEHRFLVTRRVPKIVDGVCVDPPLQGCFAHAFERYGLTYPSVGMYQIVGNAGAPTKLFPNLTGKDGQLGGEWEWLVQMRATNMVYWPADPVDYARHLRELPDPDNGKTYAFKTRYRIELRPGKYPKILPEYRVLEPRRVPEHDAYPMTQGYARLARQMANQYRIPEEAAKGYTPWPELDALQHHWDNESYYAFRLGSGVVTPPTPLCQPGVGWAMPFYVGPFVPRKVPVDYDRVPREIWEQGNFIQKLGALQAYVSYFNHKVFLVDGDVVDYSVGESGFAGGWGTHLPYIIGFPQRDMPPQYPVHGFGDPPGRTFRTAILYRFTAMTGWEPDPSHPYGEDEWHIVWSDVYLGGTRDNPDCRTLGVGFHTYDRATSAMLDSFFGLAQVGGGLEYLYPFGPAPILSRLGDFLYDGSSLTRVRPGELRLPSWALPPGW